MTKKTRLLIEDDSGNPILTAYIAEPGCDYEGADLSGLCFIGQRGLRGRCFKGAILYWANLSDSYFSGCDFRNADMRGSVLINAILTNCDFRGAKLGKDNMGGQAEIDGASFEGSIYDKNTEFPEGFSPKSAGMRYQADS
ncbi:pentapeptide repeat-containing protein [Thaumasiovibrio subtropicus]|uniref:pentapeptide repeat-containing protein n=1 Tax=Thaumasiovibrio subtropicus TaxID=1891207 RepID=UPI000B3509AD|nr:pentapeptide repeat-containing protein [Thaumasiovibrio subtropicus]